MRHNGFSMISFSLSSVPPLMIKPACPFDKCLSHTCSPATESRAESTHFIL